MAVPILLLLSEYSLFSLEEGISPLNPSILYACIVSHHFCFANNLRNLLSMRTCISISVNLAHSWHFKCMNHIYQALSEVHISLQEIHGSQWGIYSQRENHRERIYQFPPRSDKFAYPSPCKEDHASTKTI